MVPFAGPSYILAARKADIQRTVNMCLVGMETPGKAPFILQSLWGLILRYSLGSEIRGGMRVGTRAFVVAGSTLYEIFSDYTSISRGTLSTSSGPVDFATGLSQLVLVDGSSGYVMRLSTNIFATISAAGFYGSARVAFLNNRFIFTRPGTQQYQWSAIDDATSVDALDFASAEGQPDNIVAHLIQQEEVMFLGEESTEFHYQTGNADLPFQRSSGSGFAIGCEAAHSPQAIDNSAFWIGKDKHGSWMVFKLAGRQPSRISTKAVEQALKASTDISEARAYCEQRDGMTYYCIVAPGLASVWCYEVSSGSWHERCDLDALGQFKAHRGICHLFAFGIHLLGDADGKLYEMNATTYTNAGDPLVRERISPHDVIPGRVWQFFQKFYVDCTTGEAAQGDDPQVELSWSKNSGASWSNPVLRSLGRVGERFARVFWARLGIRARDIVWKIRFSGNAPFDIIDASADADQGTS